MKKLPSKQYLERRVEYNPATGKFHWKMRPVTDFANKQAWAAWNTKYAGAAAGSRSPDGYLMLAFPVGKFLAHRVAWKLLTGKDPADKIDHRNGDCTDNRKTNLRQASTAQNNHNSAVSTANTSGVKGVSWNKQNGKWVAYVKLGGVQRYLGLFTDLREAAAAVCVARKQLHREFARN